MLRLHTTRHARVRMAKLWLDMWEPATLAPFQHSWHVSSSIIPPIKRLDSWSEMMLRTKLLSHIVEGKLFNIIRCSRSSFELVSAGNLQNFYSDGSVLLLPLALLELVLLLELSFTLVSMTHTTVLPHKWFRSLVRKSQRILLTLCLQPDTGQHYAQFFDLLAEIMHFFSLGGSLASIGAVSLKSNFPST